MSHTHAMVVALAFATAAPFASAALTSVNTFGNTNGTERCLIGDAGDRCTKGGPFRGAYSITRLFSEWTGRELTRVGDATDRTWSAGEFGYIEVQGIAHYLSGNGQSYAGVWFDDGAFDPAELMQFPAGTELSPPDNRTVGVVLPGEAVVGDIVTGQVFDSRFFALPVGSASFEFVYRSRFPDNTVKHYSSDPASIGFANRVVSGTRLDHMVSWHAGTRIDRLGHIADVYLIAFERAHADDDFQDGVYAVSIPTGIPTPVPEPATWALLTAGALLLFGVRGRLGKH